MSAENILSNRDRPPAQVLADVGEALLRIKNERGFSLVEFGHEIGVSRVMISQYIAGEAEMGFLKWERARRRFPDRLRRRHGPSAGTRVA